MSEFFKDITDLSMLKTDGKRFKFWNYLQLSRIAWYDWNNFIVNDI